MCCKSINAPFESWHASNGSNPQVPQDFWHSVFTRFFFSHKFVYFFRICLHVGLFFHPISTLSEESWQHSTWLMVTKIVRMDWINLIFFISNSFKRCYWIDLRNEYQTMDNTLMRSIVKRNIEQKKTQRMLCLVFYSCY